MNHSFKLMGNFEQLLNCQQFIIDILLDGLGVLTLVIYWWWVVIFYIFWNWSIMNKHHVWSCWLYAPWVTLFIKLFSNFSNSKDSHVNKIIDITNYHTYLQVWTIYQFCVFRISIFHSKKMCIVQIYCLHHVDITRQKPS